MPESTLDEHDEEESEALPVGRLVSFTDHGPEDAPLFQEVEGDEVVSSPFVIVGGTRPGVGRLPSPARTVADEGFTAEELAALVPAAQVRVGAVPGNQVIPLPLGVLRASLAAGQPAVLLSQLHQACPALFAAPTDLDEDLVISLPPQKVQRLVHKAAPGVGGSPGSHVGRSPLVGPLDFDVSGLGVVRGSNSAGHQAFAMPAPKAKLPPPRRKSDELAGGDLRPMLEKPEPAASSMAGASPFTELGRKDQSGAVAATVASGGWSSGASEGRTDEKVSALPATPFQVVSSLPQGRPSPGNPSATGRFVSPFSIVSPGEVPAVLESPFARQPVGGREPGEFSGGPAAASPAPAGGSPPELPPLPETVSLQLSALLHGQSLESVGFDPGRVPPHVRVTLAVAPLLAQMSQGPIRVPIAEVTAGLETKYQPAFSKARPDLELLVPLRELFAHLPQSALPASANRSITSTFATPFATRANEDASLTIQNSPFKIVPPSIPRSIAPLPPAPPPPAPPSPEAPLPPPSFENKADPAHETPTGSAIETLIAAAATPAPPPPPVFPEPTLTSAEAAVATPFVLVPPDKNEIPPLAVASSPASPFLIVPEEALPPDGASAADRPTFPPPLPPALGADIAGNLAAGEPVNEPPAPPPPSSASMEPASPQTPLRKPPAAPSSSGLPRNPFSLAPGEGRPPDFGLHLPVLPFDEDPVPLESLREDTATYGSHLPPPLPAEDPASTKLPEKTEADAVAPPARTSSQGIPVAPDRQPEAIPPSSNLNPPPAVVPPPLPAAPLPSSPLASPAFSFSTPPAVAAAGAATVPPAVEPVAPVQSPPTEEAARPSPPDNFRPPSAPPTLTEVPAAAATPAGAGPASAAIPPSTASSTFSSFDFSTLSAPLAQAVSPPPLIPLPPPMAPSGLVGPEPAVAPTVAVEPDTVPLPLVSDLSFVTEKTDPPVAPVAPPFTSTADAFSAQAEEPPRRVPRLALSEQEPLPPPVGHAPVFNDPDPAFDVAPAMPPASAFDVAPAMPPAGPAKESQAVPPPLPLPSDAQRAAFASVFAPSVLTGLPQDAQSALREVDALPAIALAKLPPLEDPAGAPATAPAGATAGAETATSATPDQPPGLPDAPDGMDASTASDAPSAAPLTSIANSGFEDLSFGYVDNTTQLALRAIFSTDRTLGTQEIVDRAASLDGLRACMVHTPHASLHSTAPSRESDDVRQFRERAASLFEKTASLVRELDPEAREQSFTLRTGKIVASFFAVGDVCLAVLHAEPTFRPGVREKLTLVTRSVADMLAS